MSRYQLCTFVFRLDIASSARGLNVTGERPGGQLRPFLRAGVHGVELPVIDLERHAAERSNGIDDQRACRTRDKACPSLRAAAGPQSTSRAWTMLRTFGRTCCSVSRIRFRSNTSPHGLFEDRDLSPRPGRRCRPCAVPKKPLTQTTTLSPDSSEVDEARLHARHARGADGKRQRVLRQEGVAEQRLRLLHDFEERRVEMAEQEASPSPTGRVDARRWGRGRGEGVAAD